MVIYDAFRSDLVIVRKVRIMNQSFIVGFQKNIRYYEAFPLQGFSETRLDRIVSRYFLSQIQRGGFFRGRRGPSRQNYIKIYQKEGILSGMNLCLNVVFFKGTLF
jgi:hypothetical protein